MSEVRLNLYQADREFQVEIGGGGFGYRLLGPKFDGSSRLIKSVILSDRDKEEIIGYVKPDAKVIEDERDRLRAEIRSWEGSRDGVMEIMEEMECANMTLRAELAEARREIEKMKHDQRCSCGDYNTCAWWLKAALVGEAVKTP